MRLWGVALNDARPSEARAIGVDRPDRLMSPVAKPKDLGANGRGCALICPQGLTISDPDAVFIGGGLSHDLAAIAMARLVAGGRLVVNTVTLESEQILLDLWQQHGGDLIRLAISRAEPVGPFHGWRPLMPVTQWVWEKPLSETSSGVGT